jgi:hypothetical protein
MKSPYEEFFNHRQKTLEEIFPVALEVRMPVEYEKLFRENFMDLLA